MHSVLFWLEKLVYAQSEFATDVTVVEVSLLLHHINIHRDFPKVVEHFHLRILRFEFRRPLTFEECSIGQHEFRLLGYRAGYNQIFNVPLRHIIDEIVNFGATPFRIADEVE